MRVKRFVASNIEEAMAKIKIEMGNNAIILHTRYFKEGGVLGLFKKSYVEITAATDQASQGVQHKILTENSSFNTVSYQLDELIDHKKMSQQSLINKMQSLTSPTYPNTHNTQQQTPQHTLSQYAINQANISSANYQGKNMQEALMIAKEQKVGEKTNQDLAQELIQMKSLMSEMAQTVDNSQVSYLPKIGQDFYYLLKKQEIEEKLIKKIVKATLQQIALSPQPSNEQIKTILFNNILKQIKKVKPLSLGKTSLKQPKIFAMVGPTGVGKTTTIAKLAAMYAIMEAKKVSFITIDTYRIAAVEQLRTIGEIMDVSVNVVYSINQLKDCLLELYDSDIIFIDTAGRSHKNSTHMAELKVYLDNANPDEIFLVLSSACKYQDLLQIIEAYQDIDVSRLIFTKLDETSYFGSIYNIACRSKANVSYFTTGQNIPEDIEVADPVRLTQLLMEE